LSHMSPHEKFSILVVCTGNICRSPMVEKLLQSGLDNIAPADFSVRSAGTHALVGHSIHPIIVAALEERSVAAESFAARQLDTSMLQRADLVLAMARTHRAQIVELCPQALARTFTLRELARIATSPSGRAESVHQRWSDLILRSRRGRNSQTRNHPNDDDVTDPYGRSEQAYVQMIREISPAVSFLLNYEATARYQAPR
jgi:protein-tyrosine phosphatase